MTLWTRAAATTLATVLAAALSACSSSDEAPVTSGPGEITSFATPAGARTAAGGGDATCPDGTALAYVGAETGPNAQLGIDIVNGVRVAVDEHNEASPDCQVTLRRFDSTGEPVAAEAAVQRAIDDAGVLGVVGLPFSDESKATGNRFEQAGLVHITPSATNPLLTTNGWTTFFRGTGNDNLQAQGVAELAEELEVTTVAVVEDGSDYGLGLADAVARVLGPAAVLRPDGTPWPVRTDRTDLSALADELVAAAPDAVFFAGYALENAALHRRLDDAGFDGLVMAPDAAMDTAYLSAAGDAAEDTYFTCGCVPGRLIEGFAEAYSEVSDGRPPGTYSAEAYDATTVLLAGIDRGLTDRAALKDWVRDYDAPGISRRMAWDAIGEPLESPVHAYAVEGGEIIPLGTLR